MFIKPRPKLSGTVSGGLFKRVTEDVIKKDIENIGKSGDYESYIKDEFEKYAIKDNVNCFVRILPPHHGNPGLDFMKHIWAHEYFGGDGGYLCLGKLEKMFSIPNKRCPLCEKHVEAQMVGNAVLAKKLRAKEKYIFLVFDTAPEPQSTDVLVLVAPGKLKDMIIRLCEHPRGGVNILPDPETGQEVIFLRSKVKGDLFPSYASAQLGNVFPLTPGTQDYDIVAKQLVPFNDLLAISTEEDLDEVARYIITTPSNDPQPEQQTTVVTGRRGGSAPPPSAPPVTGRVPSAQPPAGSRVVKFGQRR